MNNKKLQFSLWSLTYSPLIWAIHMLVSYITAAIWCAKVEPSVSFVYVRIAVGVLTILALILVGLQIVKNFRRHLYGEAELPHDEDTPEDREGFLVFAHFLISSLSAIAILFIAYNFVIFRSCYS